MTEPQIPASLLFSTLQPAAARLPHLITALDARLLSGLVSIHGAKLGVWKHPAPFDENDNFLPFREDVPLSAWALAYNQGELLACRNILADDSIMIVDCATNEAALEQAAQALAASESGAYHELNELPAVLNAIGWALIPVGANQDQALFVTSPARKDYAALLSAWCHQNGRSYSTVQLAGEGAHLALHPAPDDARQKLAMQEGAEFLQRMGLFGISGDEVLSGLAELLEMIKQNQGNG